MHGTKYLIGRQPILNRNEEIVAYELLGLSREEMLSAQVKAYSWREGMC